MRSPRIAAIVLAAGASRRMGAVNKLLLPVRGKPMVSHVVEAIASSRVDRCVVVTGHDAAPVAAAVGERAEIVANLEWPEGMASSIRAGVRAISCDADAVMIALGDMPGLRARHLNELIAAFDPSTAPICVPTHGGKRGNPVLWAASYFDRLEALRGDVGARGLLEQFSTCVRRVELGDDAPLRDIDTEDAYGAVERTSGLITTMEEGT